MCGVANHLRQHRVQRVFVSCRQSVPLQPQDQLGPPVGPQGQQVDHPLPERTLLHLSRALPAGGKGAPLGLGHAHRLLDVAEEGPGRGSGLGETSQRRRWCTDGHLLAWEGNKMPC